MMGNTENKLLLRQIKKHFGSLENLPNELRGIIQDINDTYENLEDDIQLLQNSIEISSQELRDAFLKHKLDAEGQKRTINKIREAIFTLNPTNNHGISEGDASSSDSSYLFDSLINLIEERNKAEEENLKLSKAVEQNPASIVITDIHGQIEYVNPKFCDLTGYTKEEALGQNPRILKSANTSPQYFADLWNTILAGKEWRGELQNTKKNGELYWESALISPLINDQQSITHFIAIKEDITARKLADEERIRQSGLITSLLDSIPDIIFFKDTDGIYLGCNVPFAELVGKAKEEIIGKTGYQLFAKEMADIFRQDDIDLLSQKLPRHNEEWITYPDGRNILIDTLKTPYWASDGSLIGILGISRDITKRKEAEDALQQSSKKWEAIISASPDGIGMVSLDGKLQLMSAKLVAMYGYSIENKEDYLGKTFWDFIDPSNHAYLHENLRKLLAGSSEQKITEYLAIKKDNSRFYVEVNSTVLFDAKGNPESILFVERDITERKQAEEILKKSREDFKELFDNAPVGYHEIDNEGRIVRINETELKMLGYSKDELLGKQFWQVSADQELSRNSIAAKLAGDHIPMQPFTREFCRKDGVFVPVLIQDVILKDKDGRITGIRSTVQDITDRIEAEKELTQISSRLELATRAGGVGVWDLDLVDNTLVWDEQMFKLYGVDQAESVGAYETWRAGIHPEDVIQDDAEIQMAIKGVKEFDTEFRVIWPNGVMRNIRGLATVHRGDAGQPLRMVGTNWDITEQKRTESILLKAKEEADIASKAKSEFLANMSHEIRTPLNGVIGFTDLLLKTPLNKTQQQYAENVNVSGHSLLGIISDILDFSKIEAGKMELDHIKTDIIELAEQTSDIIKYHASQKGLELLLDIHASMPRFAVVDPIRLKQILVNLLGNAVKFTASGEVELKVSFKKRDENTGEFRFSIRDTGIGINDEQQKKLFKAFTQADSSTTRKFGGTGLGLTISNMLAEKMGSKIEIISEVGKGSNFFFTIEAAYETGDKLDTGSLTDIKRVLVIDDNDNNRMILEHTFINWGVEFTGIDNGLAALKLIERSKPFDVIIVDYHMPYLNGIDTIRMIRQQLNLSPEKQPTILLHSSSDDVEIYEECKKLGVRFNLTKPVKSQELLHYLKNIHTHPAHPAAETQNNEPIENIETTGERPEVILVAEDVVLNMLLVTTIIKQMIPNVTVLEAKNGLIALEMTHTYNPDLILMDVQMPEMSGIEATIEIRNHEKGKERRIPIVALTAGAIKGEKEKCLESGMDDFLTKPIDREALRGILEKHLASCNKKRRNSLHNIAHQNTNSHFDEAMLMENIANNQVILDELLGVVPFQISYAIESLERAVSENNVAEIRQSAHSVSATSVNMCFKNLAGLAQKIESFPDSTIAGQSGPLVQELILEWEQVQLLLRDMKREKF
ncbi:MAG: PAS domain S-box protein [Bacteroidales bacterium]